jgi:hypothetical protein
MIVSDERVAHFVGDCVGTVIQPPYTCLGIEQGGNIVTGIVFNCWTGNDIELTVASTSGHLPRRLLRRAAAYVFGELGCSRVSFTTENPAVVEMAKRLSAQPEGRKRHLFGPGRDGVILGILREEWKIH